MIFQPEPGRRTCSREPELSDLPDLSRGSRANEVRDCSFSDLQFLLAGAAAFASGHAGGSTTAGVQEELVFSLDVTFIEQKPFASAWCDTQFREREVKCASRLGYRSEKSAARA